MSDKRLQDHWSSGFCYELLVLLLFLFESVPLPLGALESLRYFIVELPGSSI